MFDQEVSSDSSLYLSKIETKVLTLS